jgi:hypothetical protein
MNFKNWLNIQETGTTAGAPVAGAFANGAPSPFPGGSIAPVPTRLFAAPVSRKFAKSIATKGLAGPVEIQKFSTN